MFPDRFHVTVLVALVAFLFVVTGGVQGRPTMDATGDYVGSHDGCLDQTSSCRRQPLWRAPWNGAVERPLRLVPPNRTDRTGRQQPAPMSASVARTGPSSFRVAVRNARYGQSASVDPPQQVGDSGFETDFRELHVESEGGARAFALDFTVEQNLSDLSGAAATGPPAAFDTPLLYSDVRTDARASDFALTYDFDVETDFLRETDAGRNDVVVAVYRGGDWQSVTVGRSFRSGNETVVTASVDEPGLVAVGLQHPDIGVTNVEPRGQPVLSNRTTRLELTVENRGSRDGTAELPITANDRTLATPSVAVSAGSTRTVSVPVTFQEPGETDIEVGDYERTINVTRPTPNITVSELSVGQSRIGTGETVTVEATVTNTGTAPGTGAVPFRAFGDVVTVKQVSLAPGETRTVRFSQQFAAPGEFQVSVDEHTATVRVRGTPVQAETPAGARDEISPTDAGSESDRSFQWALILLGVGVIGLFALVTLGRMLE